MANDISSSTRVLENNIQRVAQAKTKLIDEEKKLIEDSNRLERKAEKDIIDIRERVKKDLELQSRIGEEEVLTVKNLNQKNVQQINANSQKQMLELAQKTANEIEAARKISELELHNLRAKNAEVYLETAKRADDPFYRPKQFSTSIQEKENDFIVKIKLPPHEARDVSASGFSNQLKLSFSRSYSADTNINPSQTNITRSHESVTETHTLPALLDFKKVSRKYEDGALVLQIPKLNPLSFKPRNTELEETKNTQKTNTTSETSS